MLKIVQADSASAIAEHTPYAQLYTRNYTRAPVDRIMPNVFNMAYYKQFGTLPGGVRTSVIVPIIHVDINYQGPFAIADQVPLERPLPWDRKVT